jgi:hypothetical protein
MTLQDRLVDLADELLNLFEDGNKLVYKRLISLRHTIRNKLSALEIYDGLHQFYLENSASLETKDIGAFKRTQYADDIDLIWSELSGSNRALVWKWVDAIIRDTLA